MRFTRLILVFALALLTGCAGMKQQSFNRSVNSQIVLRPDQQAFGANDASVVGVRNETPFLLVAGAAAFYGTFVTGSEKLASRWLSETGTFSIWADDYALEATKK